jgi:hypothetical protein
MEKPIVSINIIGGLGNQMFQLAGAFAYAKKYNGALQVLKVRKQADFRPLYWDSYLNRFSPYLVDSVPDNLVQWKENGPTEFTPPPPLTSQGILLGDYLQSPQYFNDKEVSKDIKSLFAPPETALTYIQEKYRYLLENRERVVVVHARRTDYLKNEYIINFHGPLTIDYYKQAIQEMCKTVINPIFLLASDDVKYWHDNIDNIPELNKENIHILDGENEIDALTLLQQFHYYIIANSTFSWWACWLSNDARRVIAPAKWFGPWGIKNYQDIYCSHWEKI